MEKNAIFGLFTNDKASVVFKDLGKIAKNSASQTDQLGNAVTKASNRAIKASEAQRAAQAKVTIAQSQYNEVMAKGNVTESQRLAAQERLTVALNRSDAAAIESEASTSALTMAEAKATFGAKELGNAHGFATSKMGSMFKVAASGAAALAGFELFKFGKDSLAAADAFETSQVKLQTAVKNSGHSWIDYAKPVSAMNTKMEALGFSSIETQDALALMTSALKDPKKALNDLGLAADVARKYNLSLSDAGLVVVKTSQGYTKQLKQFGIDLPVAAAGAEKLKVAKENLAKQTAKLNSMSAVGNSTNKRTIAQDNAQIKAQTHLATLQNKYGNNLTKTVAQTTALEKAQARANKTQDVGTSGSNAYATQQQRVADAQAKVNDLANSGTTAIKGLTDATSGSAAAAAKTYAGKLKVLNNDLYDLKIAAGNELMGPLSTLADWMVKTGLPDTEKFGHAMSNLWHATLNVGNAELNIIHAGGNVAHAVGNVAHAGGNVLQAANDVISFLDGGSNSTPVSKTTFPPFKKIFAETTKAGKPLTSTHPGGATYVTIHVAGSVVTEKKLIDTVHAGIAQKMVRAGVNPKGIGK